MNDGGKNEFDDVATLAASTIAIPWRLHGSQYGIDVEDSVCEMESVPISLHIGNRIEPASMLFL
jgi:hypothetical protein